MEFGLPWPGRERAAEAEAAGAHAFCAGEFSDTNAYVTSAEMALATSQALTGPGIAYAFARSPFVHASALRHLNRLAPGRVFLGLGAGTPRMNRDWFGVDVAHPAPQMAELIDVIQMYLHTEDGDLIRYTGTYYTVDADIRAPVFGRLDVPILIGAFNKHMLRVAGGHADGVLGHGIFTDRWWSEQVDPELTHGATAAGRSPASLRRWGWVITAVDDAEPARAVRDARLQIAFYLTVKTYDSLVELHGWQDQVNAIRQAFRAGKPEAMAEHVSDEMLWAIAVCGDSDQAREMAAQRARLPDLAFFSPPSFLVSRRRRAQYDAAAIGLANQVCDARVAAF